MLIIRPVNSHGCLYAWAGEVNGQLTCSLESGPGFVAQHERYFAPVGCDGASNRTGGEAGSCASDHATDAVVRAFRRHGTAPLCLSCDKCGGVYAVTWLLAGQGSGLSTVWHSPRRSRGGGGTREFSWSTTFAH